MTFRTLALLAALVTTGLSAGLFYAFSCAVMPGLRLADDDTFVRAVRRINTAILNGWFALGFGGALLFTALALALHLPADHRAPLPWIVAALVLYAAVIAVTGAVNVPLNNSLEAAGDPGSRSAAAALRAGFEATWVRWNVVRAVLSAGASGCLAWASVLHGKGLGG